MFFARLILFWGSLLSVVHYQCSLKTASVLHPSIREASVLRSQYSSAALYLERLVARKKIAVDGLLRRHQDPSDPLVMRMTYMATEARYNVSRCLKRAATKEGYHTVSVLVDMKRTSPTRPDQRAIVEFASASKYAELLTLCGVDAFLINTDEQEYGGRFSDLKESSSALKALHPKLPPACIVKDIFLHPIQV
jgi:hypothetical protein